MSRATVLALLGTACGGGTPDADPVVRADSAGVEIVRNASADRELAWEFEREWSIGAGIAVTDAGVVFTALAGEGDRTSSQRLAVWSPEADRTLVSFERMPDRLADFPTCGFRGLPVPPLFAPKLVWDARGSRVVLNVGASYVVDVFDEGRLVRSIRRNLEPRPVDRDMALREVGEGLPIPVANCTVPPDEVVRGRGYADVLPSVRRVTLSPKGDVWVLRGHVAGEPIRIDVFAADGAYLGTAPPNVPFPVAFLGAERMVVIERDAMDAPRLAAWRIGRP